MQSALISPGQRLGAGLIAVLGALFLAAPASGEMVIAREAGLTSVSAHNGRLVWSSYRTASKDYVLKTRFRGVISELPARPRKVAFDVDLGSDRRGRTVAVYSRCEREGTVVSPPVEARYGASASGCGVRMFDFATGREARVPVASTGRYNEIFPSIWRNRIAFWRVRNFHPRVVVGLVANGRRVRELPVTGHIFANPKKLELRGRRVAVATEDGSDNCHPPNSRGSVDDGTPSEVWLATIGERWRRVDRGCTWEPKVFVNAVTIGSQGLLYALGRRTGDGLFEFDRRLGLFRFGVRRPTERPFEGASGYVGSLSRDGSATYFTRAVDEPAAPGAAPYEVVEADPVAF